MPSHLHPSACAEFNQKAAARDVSHHVVWVEPEVAHHRSGAGIPSRGILVRDNINLEKYILERTRHASGRPIIDGETFHDVRRVSTAE